MSNALEHGLVVSRSNDMKYCILDMIAAVVDPVGQKAYWSVKERVGGGLKSAGYKE